MQPKLLDPRPRLARMLESNWRAKEALRAAWDSALISVALIAAAMLVTYVLYLPGLPLGRLLHWWWVLCLYVVVWAGCFLYRGARASSRMRR